MFNNSQDNLQNALAEFKKACLQLLSTKYILADKKISIILQLIAKHPELYNLVAKCMEGFDFKTAFAVAKPQDARTKGLKLPMEPNHVVAFVFCLLLSFDTKQTDFKNFLSAFYYDIEGPTKEFEVFVKETIVPFCANVIALASKKEPQQVNVPNVVAASQLQPQQTPFQEESRELPVKVVSMDKPQEKTNKDSILDADIVYALKNIIKELIAIIAKDTCLSTETKEEILIVCEAFEQAVSIGMGRAIRTMYIALKNTIRCSSIAKYLEEQCDMLDKLILENNLD